LDKHDHIESPQGMVRHCKADIHYSSKVGIHSRWIENEANASLQRKKIKLSFGRVAQTIILNLNGRFTATHRLSETSTITK